MVSISESLHDEDAGWTSIHPVLSIGLHSVTNNEDCIVMKPLNIVYILTMAVNQKKKDKKGIGIHISSLHM